MANKKDAVGFRIEAQKKQLLEKTARSYGYGSLSEYLRDVIDFYVIPVKPSFRHVIDKVQDEAQ